MAKAIDIHARNWQLFEQVSRHLVDLSGAPDHEQAFAALRDHFRERSTSPAAWVHKQAQTAYPMSEGNSINPELFFEILGEIDTKEKWNAKFASLPPSEALNINRFLTFMLREFFPGMRSHAQATVSALPFAHVGGRPPKRPDEAKCQAIYEELRNAKENGNRLGRIKKDIAKRMKLKDRTVERIWSEGKKLAEKVRKSSSINDINNKIDE